MQQDEIPVTELTIQEYADQTIEAYRVADPTNDPEWDEAGRLEFLADELVNYIARMTGLKRKHIRRETCVETARERLEVARGERTACRHEGYRWTKQIDGWTERSCADCGIVLERIAPTNREERAWVRHGELPAADIAADEEREHRTR